MTDYRQHPSVVAHWRDDSLQPIPEAQEAEEILWFAVPPEPDTEQMWEGLRGRLEKDGTATVLAVPAYLYDVNFGDRVNVMRSAENALVATGVERDALNFTFRVLLKSDDPNAWQPLASELAEQGCLLDFISPRFFAISCGEPQTQEVADRLFTLERDGVLHYETGRTQQLR
ncbi:DUF4265 domain-containing protein [Arthrobacter sp. AK01]|uniref:DUF4265 domain-containing protein n=1 Tax=Arthrobacter sp. AK01 TaxID=2894084 RepID=UPI001E28CE61|nr:DUF4265 domain-containing protein [Arthrobacter sp. AK01]MCD4851418.1 DUF4265 domain-containing protein [Arthrobacter sp. AK01]